LVWQQSKTLSWGPQSTGNQLWRHDNRFARRWAQFNWQFGDVWTFGQSFDDWKLEVGSWKLEIGNWKLEIGYQIESN